jgi:hypothetical protein
MMCRECGRCGIKYTYGNAKDCWRCYCKRLKLSPRGVLELQSKTAEIQSLRGIIKSLEGKLKTQITANKTLTEKLEMSNVRSV